MMTAQVFFFSIFFSKKDPHLNAIEQIMESYLIVFKDLNYLLFLLFLIPS